MDRRRRHAAAQAHAAVGLLLASLCVTLAGCEARELPPALPGRPPKHVTTAESPPVEGRTFRVGVRFDARDDAARRLAEAMEQAARDTDVAVEPIPSRRRHPADSASDARPASTALVVVLDPSPSAQGTAAAPAFAIQRAHPGGRPDSVPAAEAGRRAVRAIARYLKGDRYVPGVIVLAPPPATR